MRKSSAPPTGCSLPKAPSSAWNWPRAAGCGRFLPPRPRWGAPRRWRPLPTAPRRWPPMWPKSSPAPAAPRMSSPSSRPPPPTRRRCWPKPGGCWRWKGCRTRATWARCCAAPRPSGLTGCCWAQAAPRPSPPKCCGLRWGRRGGCRWATALAALRGRGVSCLAAALYHSRPLDEAGAAFPRGVCVVIGSEGQGLSQPTVRACSAAVRIPMTDRVESLNAGVAGIILLWHFRGV